MTKFKQWVCGLTGHEVTVLGVVQPPGQTGNGKCVLCGKDVKKKVLTNDG